MKIALDYDDTFTADRELFTGFVKAAVKLGYEVKFVTARHNPPDDIYWNEDIREDAAKLGIDIVYCNHLPKRRFYDADMWIDDTPEAIVDNEVLQFGTKNVPAM